MHRQFEIETPLAPSRANLATRGPSTGRDHPSRPPAQRAERPRLPRSEATPAVLAFGEYHLDEAEQRLLRGETPIALNPKSFAVLVHLSRNAGRLVTKDDLFDAVWPDTVVSDATLTSCIKEVRKALEDDARRPTYVETAHRRGYRFIAPVRRASGEPALSVVRGGADRGPAVVHADPEIFELLSRLGVDVDGRREVVLVRNDA